MKDVFQYQGCCTHQISKSAYAVEAKHAFAIYPGAREKALIDISFYVTQGQRVALVGANGAGKSTLLKLIGGLIPVSCGSVEVFGHVAGGCQHQVAYLPQRRYIDWSFPVTVKKFVLTGRYVHLGWFRRLSQKDMHFADLILERLKLNHLRERPIDTLSGGEQQRLLLARTLAHDARLLLLDEPMNAIDAQTKEILTQTLDAIKQAGKTVIMATHDVAKLEGAFDMIIYINEGRIVEVLQ